MTKFEILSHLLTVVVIIALMVGAYCLLVLKRAMSPNALHEWLDRESDTFADYMEREQERRTAMYHGDPDASSPLRWYGMSYLIERRLFVWQYDAVAAINRRQLGFAKDPERGSAGGFFLFLILMGIAGGMYGCAVDNTSMEDVERQGTCIDNARYINDLGGSMDVNDC